MNKKIGSKLIITLLVLTATLMLSETAFAADTMPEGYGSKEVPYKIRNYAELQAFARIVNGTHDSASQNVYACAELENDIKITESDDEWTPIALSVPEGYRGTFDGKGKKIIGLKYSNKESASEIGLFSCIHGLGRVQNVGVVDGNFSVGNAWTVGGVAGESLGTIQNCYYTGTISCGEYSQVIGGITGRNYGEIKSCYNAGSVSGGKNSQDIGGVVGLNLSFIMHCYNSGNVSGGENSENIGGVAGHNNSSGKIWTCYNCGNVSGGKSVGGVAGKNDEIITDAYYDTDIAKNIQAIGDDNAADQIKNVKGLTTKEMTGLDCTAYNNCWQFSQYWTLTRGYPQLNAFYVAGTDPGNGDTTEHSHDGRTFTAWTDALAAKQHNDSNQKANNSLPCEPGSYYLTQDVDLGSNYWRVPQGETSLCMNGHSITSMEDDDGAVVLDEENSTLNLYDEHTGDSAGTITDKEEDGVLLNEDCSVNMYGGRISGCESGVNIDDSGAHFTLYNGEITGNNLGVDAYGDFVLENGTIANNGKGVDIYGSETDVTMHNGIITGNGIGVDYKRGTFKIAGTNACPQIIGNNKNGTTKNLLITGDGTNTRKIMIDPDATISENARIGISMQEPAQAIFVSGLLNKIQGNKMPTDIFSSDDPNYFVIHVVTDAGLMANHDNQRPIGELVSAEDKGGSIHIAGWAYDPNDTTKSIDVHVYIGGEAGSTEAGNPVLIKADKENADAPDSDAGKYHWFDETIATDKRGAVPVYAYGIDLEDPDNNNASIGNKTVTIADVQHTHNFNYAAGTGGAANTITATCIEATNKNLCSYQSEGITIALNKPVELKYNGSPKAASISGYPKEAIEGLAAEPEIKYYKSTGAGSTTPDGDALTGAPAKAGNYVAQITWGGKTVGVAFAIAKAADPTDPDDQLGDDGTAVGPGASEEVADEAVMNLGDEKDPEGSRYGILQLKSTRQTKSSIKLTWKKNNKAVKYLIYGTACGKTTKMKKITTVKASSYTFKKLDGKKLKKGKYYKFLVIALDENNKVVSTSKIAHATTPGGKFGNHKSVKTKAPKNKVTLTTGKSFKLNAKAIPKSKKKKVRIHRGTSYESSDPAVATVTGKGVINAKAPGTCKVYAYAQNGAGTTITVTVK